MRAQKFNLAIIAICITVLTSCRPESQLTSETALASISNTDRYMYVGNTEAKASDKLMIHLKIGDLSSSSKKSNKTSIPYSKPDPGTNHIGPYQIEESFSIEDDFWNLEQAIVAWIFSMDD